jgi:integrase
MAKLTSMATAKRSGGLKSWRLHDLRRAMATDMVRLDVSALVVVRLLNHTPQGVTARAHALHSYEMEKRAALMI